MVTCQSSVRSPSLGSRGLGASLVGFKAPQTRSWPCSCISVIPTERVWCLGSIYCFLELGLVPAREQRADVTLQLFSLGKFKQHVLQKNTGRSSKHRNWQVV